MNVTTNTCPIGTTLTFSKNNKAAHINTDDKLMMAELRQLMAEHPEMVLIRQTFDAMEVSFPVEWVDICPPDVRDSNRN